MTLSLLLLSCFILLTIHSFVIGQPLAAEHQLAWEIPLLAQIRPPKSKMVAHSLQYTWSQTPKKLLKSALLIVIHTGNELAFNRFFF